MTASHRRPLDRLARQLTALAGTAIIVVLGIMIGIGFFIGMLPVLITLVLDLAVSWVGAQLRNRLLGET